MTSVFNDGQESDAVVELSYSKEYITAHLIEVYSNNDISNTPGPIIHIARIDSEYSAACSIANLHDSMAAHILTSQIFKTNQYIYETFYGLLIDTGCSCFSSR